MVILVNPQQDSAWWPAATITKPTRSGFVPNTHIRLRIETTDFSEEETRLNMQAALPNPASTRGAGDSKASSQRMEVGYTVSTPPGHAFSTPSRAIGVSSPSNMNLNRSQFSFNNPSSAGGTIGRSNELLGSPPPPLPASPYELQVWFYQNSQGAEKGPVDRTQMLGALESGRMHRDSRLCWRKGLPNWVQIETLPEFAEDLIQMRARFDNALLRKQQLNNVSAAVQSVGSSGAQGLTKVATLCTIL